MTRTLNFLYDSAFKMQQSAPEISQSLMEAFMDRIEESELEIPASLKSTFCQNCFCIYIPGINCSVESQSHLPENENFLIGAISRKPTKADRTKQHILYTCHGCSKSTRFLGATRSDFEQVKVPQKLLVVKKKKKNGKRRNDLASLINKEAKSTGEYSLTDFLSNI